MDKAFCEVESGDPGNEKRWMEKHGFSPDENGGFRVDSFEGKEAVTFDKLFENIKANVSIGDYNLLYTEPYDPRTFVMICGGPSLSRHLDEIRQKAFASEHYLIACSNMTGGYLLEHGITAHAHFVIDPQEKKRFDLMPGKTSGKTQYWINAGCDPSVFAILREQGIRPFIFLADFDSEGKARDAVKQSLPEGLSGMMAIQGGTMAGLRAINLADALGFRKMQYYGFDGAVEVFDGKARPYAYEKKRGEVIIDVTCDQCSDTFSTTLILQKQVNEFLSWTRKMPWVDIEIIGGGLIAHCQRHLIEKMAAKPAVKHRYSGAYAVLQRELHAAGGYGVTGKQFIPTIFHAIAQLAKRLGAVSVLDYGAANNATMQAVKEHLWLPPNVTDHCYDPFVDAFMAEPGPADFVICTDVMEHVEPECTFSVLDHIRDLTKRIAFFSIALVPARKTLSDGRNAHINLRDSEFWLRELQQRFILSEVKAAKDVLLVVAQSIDDVRTICLMNRKLEQAAA